MKKYTIEMQGITADECYDFDPLPLADAKREIAALKLRFPARKFFLSTAGNSGMGCYLNPDGNHDITGKAW
jgi:hypothetical protein